VRTTPRNYPTFCNRDVIAILPTGFWQSYDLHQYVLARDEWLITVEMYGEQREPR
jgi:hypothetical protein